MLSIAAAPLKLSMASMIGHALRQQTVRL